jgi:hypothetical protein
MKTDSPWIPPGPLVLMHSDGPGQITAHLVGMPELRASAATREEALTHLQRLITEALTSGRLAVLEMPNETSLMDWFGYARDDPDFGAYLDEIRRQRQEVYDDSQAEMEDKGCSGSSSTPTT